MKKLRNIVLTMVVSTMMLSMAGCGTTPANNDTEGSTEGTTEVVAENGTDEETPLMTSNEGKLVWATNAEFEPYEYREGGEIVGIDAEIAQYIADDLGLELVIEDMAFDSIIPAVTSGKADLGIAGMTVTEDRLMNVNFTDTYVNAGQVIIVADGSSIAGAADLEGKTIGVQLGTTGDLYVSDNIPNVTVERYNKGFEAVQSLLQGKIDAVVIDGEPAKAFVNGNEGIGILETPLTEEEYAIAIAKEKEELLNNVNEILAEMQENGKMAEITSKYLGDE